MRRRVRRLCKKPSLFKECDEKSYALAAAEREGYFFFDHFSHVGSSLSILI